MNNNKAYDMAMKAGFLLINKDINKEEFDHILKLIVSNTELINSGAKFTIEIPIRNEKNSSQK